MPVNAIGLEPLSQNVNFRKKRQDEANQVLSNENSQDTFESGHKLKAKGRRKLGTALVSLFPGAGYLANGQIGKALLSGIGILGSATAGILGTMALYSKEKPRAAIVTAAVSSLAALSLYITSIVCAVKNSAKNIEVVECPAKQ